MSAAGTIGRALSALTGEGLSIIADAVADTTLAVQDGHGDIWIGLCTLGALKCAILITNAPVAVQWTGNATLILAEDLTYTAVHVHTSAL